MKKTAFFLCVMILLGMLGACSANNSGEEPVLSAQMNEQLSERIMHENGYDNGCEAHEALLVQAGDLKGKNTDSCISVYYYSLCGEFYLKDGKLEEGAASFFPGAASFRKTDSGYELSEYWVPRDGDNFDKDLKATFPAQAYRLIPQSVEEHNALALKLEKQVKAQLQKAGK